MTKCFRHIFLLVAFSSLLRLASHGTENENILVVRSINITGNTITNEKIILRELPFRLGDTLSIYDLSGYANQSKENLNNTLLFNFITISYNISDKSVEWDIDVEERWYIWPFPILEFEDRNLSAFLRNASFSKLNYGAYIKVNNFRGMREQIRLRMVLGYRNEVVLQYITQNLDREKKHGISALASYFTNREINYNTFGNQPNYFRSDNGPARQVLFADITYHYRPKHHWYHALTIGALQATISDSLANLNPNYFGAGNNSFWYSHIKYEATLDKRNSKIFPLHGYLLKSEVGKQGLFKNEPLDLWYIKLTTGLYGKVAPRLFAGTDLSTKLSTQTNLPYYMNKGIGYNDFIRGYEHYVTNGSSYYINKNSLKFELLPTKVINLPLVPEGKFKKAHIALYWSIFGDTGYVKPDAFTPSNSLEGKMIYGYGTGLYIVAYYDLVLRIEYSFNGFGEQGFFFHIGTPFLLN
ncbi:MAG: POTRA domain-containing protein [Tenuifilaceae bacterium]|nr:POTRA domain-containing protein [Tenuifilaceae bacterium]